MPELSVDADQDRVMYCGPVAVACTLVGVDMLVALAAPCAMAGTSMTPTTTTINRQMATARVLLTLFFDMRYSLLAAIHTASGSRIRTKREKGNMSFFSKIKGCTGSSHMSIAYRHKCT